MTENMDRVDLKVIKARTTPISVKGKEVMRAKGCKKLLN
jgi:hypothetical protein